QRDKFSALRHRNRSRRKRPLLNRIHNNLERTRKKLLLLRILRQRNSRLRCRNGVQRFFEKKFYRVYSRRIFGGKAGVARMAPRLCHLPDHQAIALNSKCHVKKRHANGISKIKFQ
ncbi:MAG TPA: hypothetical protein VGL74_06770, partial [Terriglobales bacterium]